MLQPLQLEVYVIRATSQSLANVYRQFVPRSGYCAFMALCTLPFFLFSVMSNDRYGDIRHAIGRRRFAVRERGEISEVNDFPNQFPMDFTALFVPICVLTIGITRLADNIRI